MTCEECEQILLDSKSYATHKGWILGISVLDLAKIHSQSCSACGHKLSEISGINEILEQVRISSSQINAPTEIEANLLREFRHWTAPLVQTTPKYLRWKLLWAPLVALTLVLALISYSVLRPGPYTGDKTVKVDADAGKILPPPRNTRGLEQALTQDSLASKERTGSRHTRMRARKLMHEQSPEEPSLPVGDEFFLNGGGNIVRVRIPLASLAAMGLPMYPDALDRRVTADVARDPFGAVVAVRLIDTGKGTN